MSRVIFTGIVLIFVQAVNVAGGEDRDQLAPIPEQNEELTLSIEQYEAAVEEIEREDGPFSAGLIEPLTGLGRSYLSLGEHEKADEVLRLAQHLTHRSDGVHSLSQLPAIDLLTEKYLLDGEPLKADQQQRFALYVNEHHYGKNSADVIPALYKLAHWYLETGQFRLARSHYERAIDIIKSEGGDLDLRLLTPLKLIAETRRLEGICCSYKSLESALEVIEKNPNATNDMMVDLYLALGDAYVVSNEAEKAHGYYQLAWNLSQDDTEPFSTPRKIVMSNLLETARSQRTRFYRVVHDPFNPFSSQKLEEMTRAEKLAHEGQPPQEFLLPLSEENYNVKIADARDKMQNIDPVTELVGDPFKFNFQQLRYILPLNQRAREELAGLYVKLEYTVDADGGVKDVEVVDSNAPLKIDRLMRNVLLKTKFRPALANGMPVKTEQLSLTQTFQ